MNFEPESTRIIQGRFHQVVEWRNIASIIVGVPSSAMGCFTASAATYYVGSIASLTSRIGSALPGDEIVVSNGVYVTSASIGISGAGTAANRILIREHRNLRSAAVPGCEFTGRPRPVPEFGPQPGGMIRE